MDDTCVTSLIDINTTNKQLESNLLPKAICCLQTCNIAESEVTMGDTCEANLIVICTAINQLETNVSLLTICCLRLFVVYKFVKL